MWARVWGPLVLVLAAVFGFLLLTAYHVTAGWPVFVVVMLGSWGAVWFTHFAVEGVHCRREADAFSAARVVVLEAIAHGAHSVNVLPLVMAAHDEQLWSAWEGLRSAEKQLWDQRIERGECSDR